MGEQSAAKRQPGSEMMSHGYRPSSMSGSLKIPVFQTSTFVFDTAEQGKRFFELACGLRAADEGERRGHVYSRLGNPNLDLAEDRLTLWDGAERALLFSSGMAAIATTMLAHLRPGDVVLYSSPVYGGTDHLMTEVLPAFGVETVAWESGMTEAAIADGLAAVAGTLKLVFVETPANPTLDLFDIDVAARIAAEFSTPEHRVLVAVDNTFLGPLWQRPFEQGADLVLYSATKYLGGHSDIIAGACLGSRTLLEPIATMRTILGTMADPNTAWLLTRSLETLEVRFHKQVENAGLVARALADHPRVVAVRYPGLLRTGEPQHDLYKRQCTGPGAMIAFEVADGEAGAFRFLDHLELIKIAVSLGSTESLAEHPATMTHAGVDPESRRRHGVADGLVRLSIGVENAEDLLADIVSALDAV
jgi:methionine-gamma-lyase